MIGIAIANSLGLNFLRGIFGPYKSRVEADGGITEAGQCVDAVSGKLLDASLLLIPSGYKSGKVYAEIPTNGNGDLTWTRASNATRTNSSGLLESMGSGVPRLDYTYGSCPALLLEPQRTNLALYSEEFNNAAWTKNLAGIGSVPIVTANAGISPSGTTTADRIQFALNGGTTASDVSDIRQLIVVTSASYTLSFWVKSFDETSSYQMLVRDVNGFVNRILVTGVWERYTITRTYSSGNATIGFGIRGGQTPTNPNTADILVWGAQFEVGAYPTTYIPTTTASATRVADSFSRNNIYTNGLITSSGGTWFVELLNNLSLTRDASDVGLFIGNSSNGTSGDVLAIRNNGTGRLAITKRVSGTQTGLYDTTTDTTKVAIKWNGSTADVFVNGTKVVSATAFTTTNMEFLFGDGVGVPTFVQAMALYPSPLSDTDCTTLTTL